MVVLKVDDRFLKVPSNLYKNLGGSVEKINDLVELAATEREGYEKARNLLNKLVNCPELEYDIVDLPVDVILE